MDGSGRVPDDIDEADLDAELAMLEDDLEGLEEAEGESSATPSYLQPGEPCLATEAMHHTGLPTCLSSHPLVSCICLSMPSVLFSGLASGAHHGIGGQGSSEGKGRLAGCVSGLV